MGAYCYLNVGPVFTPGTLPMTALDQAVPFLLWTVWPYVGLNVSNAVMPFFVRGRSNFRQLVVTLSIAMGRPPKTPALWSRKTEPTGSRSRPAPCRSRGARRSG